jgi:hypothetical protein
MLEWETRLARDAPPRLWQEHVLRYRLALPVLERAEQWADLGCGDGTAAAAALGERFNGRVLLVDNAAEALADASRSFPDAQTLEANLGTDEGVTAVRAALDEPGSAPGVVTCFETIPQLEVFVPLLGLLLELPQRGWTVVLSVPNDAFWSVENPRQHSSWGEGAFEELRRMLPERHVLLRQVPLAGSAVVRADEGGEALTIDPVAISRDRVPTHFIAALGPAAGTIGPLATADAVDAEQERRRERQRESDLAVFEARLAELEQFSR